jgi:tetratricopeptide (TPR) repeat protein
VIQLLKKTGKEYESFGSGLNIYSTLLAYCGLAMAYIGDFDKGEALLEDGLRFAHEINDKTSLGIIEYFYGWLFSWIKGDGKNAMKHFPNSVKYLEEARWPTVLGLAWSGLGSGYHLLGNPQKARKFIEKGLSIQKDVASYWLCAHFVLLCMVHFDSGDIRAAQRSAEEAVRLSYSGKEKNHEGYSRLWLGRILGKAERSEKEGKQQILHGIRICEELKIRPHLAQGYLYLGEFCVDRGQQNEAMKNLRKAEEMFQEMGMDYWLAKTSAVLSEL